MFSICCGLIGIGDSLGFDAEASGDCQFSVCIAAGAGTIIRHEEFAFSHKPESFRISRSESQSDGTMLRDSPARKSVSCELCDENSKSEVE